MKKYIELYKNYKIISKILGSKYSEKNIEKFYKYNKQYNSDNKQYKSVLDTAIEEYTIGEIINKIGIDKVETYLRTIKINRLKNKN